jgi:predicted translin family RNA/ssDNA-binding protein
MIDLKNIQRDFENYDSLREDLIKQSRILLKSSKKLIYSVHKGNKNECDKNLKEVENIFKKLNLLLKKNSKLEFEGSYSEACQEMVEGILYYDYVYSGSLRKLNVSSEDYLMGVADLTGELVRRVVSFVIKGKFDEVYEINDFVQNLYKQLLNFNFRNGNLRKKFDSIRWNLNKIEDVLYDLEVRKS